MSAYLPDGYTQPKAAIQNPGQASGQDALLNALVGDDDRKAALIQELFGDPNLLFRAAPQFFSYITSWIEQSGIQIPISQVPGFTQFTMQSATPVAAEETTASDVYVNLATTGPSITGIPAGTYMVAYGSRAHNTTGGGGCAMSVDVNGGGAADADAAETFDTSDSSITIMRAVTVSAANNTFTAKYRRLGTTGTAHFTTRWMIALRTANA